LVSLFSQKPARLAIITTGDGCNPARAGRLSILDFAAAEHLPAQTASHLE